MFVTFPKGQGENNAVTESVMKPTERNDGAASCRPADSSFCDVKAVA